ncbi:MAG: helix-turn-helix domain-containing protein [Bacteroides sp.]|uniref:helix-turn-helix domain-containing protein n=1 Tax=Bacteroides sp. TaxID=29523 RepID=UPI0026E0EF63|nr:helix-turn-helix domain-containing protein [Bacteroides sp.]MDO5421208.1 helix-turn-helix domain-containing protein [Bacteroides sp.]
MEVITIESKAFAVLVEKIDGITAYVEASRQREQEQQQGHEEKNHRKADTWMTGNEVCEYLEISPRTLQRYRTNRILAFSICGKKIRG